MPLGPRGEASASGSFTWPPAEFSPLGIHPGKREPALPPFVHLPPPPLFGRAPLRNGLLGEGLARLWTGDPSHDGENYARLRSCGVSAGYGQYDRLGFFGHSLETPPSPASGWSGAELVSPWTGRPRPSRGRELVFAVLPALGLGWRGGWPGERLFRGREGEAGRVLCWAGSDGASSLASLAEAHDALHHFSCKMLTPRHCAGNCSFKPPLLPQ